ncbi:hypothetical protein ACOME3_009663 [Neoechinorhynchus agilis]
MDANAKPLSSVNCTANDTGLCHCSKYTLQPPVGWRIHPPHANSMIKTNAIALHATNEQFNGHNCRRNHDTAHTHVVIEPNDDSQEYPKPYSGFYSRQCLSHNDEYT